MAPFQDRKPYEYFAKFFGKHYFKFVVCTGHTVFFLMTALLFWTSPALPKLIGTDDNPLGKPISGEECDLIGSLTFIGAASGPILFIPAAEYFGKKNLLSFLSLIPPLTFGTLLVARVVEIYYVCRVLQGIYVGAATSIVPVYVAEILADEDRNFYMSLGSTFGYCGVLAVYAIGPFTSFLYFNGFLALLSSIFMVLLTFGCPHTPYHVMKREGKDATNKLLMILRPNFKNDEADEIKNVVDNQVRESYLDLFKSLSNLKLFFMGTTPLILQQFAGMTVLMSYSGLIFEKTNMNLTPSVCSLIVGCFQVTTSLLTPLLLQSGKFSLRALLLFCLCGMGCCNLILSSYFFFWKETPSLNLLPLVIFLLFITISNCGMDPIPWLVLGQIYPKNINSVGTALSTCLAFLTNFPSLYLFSKIPLEVLYLSSACCCCLGIPYVIFIFTEPKNVSENEM